MEERQTPILWHSNAPYAGTGYGMQTALFGPLLKERLGYDVAFSAFYGLHGSRRMWQSDGEESYIIYPGNRDAFGNDVIGRHKNHWFQGRTGLVILLTDPWVMSSDVCAQLPLLAWIPVDHDPLIPRTEEWIWRSGAIPLAMSRFGQRVMEEGGIEDPLYVPHGVNTSVFHPVDDDHRQAIRDVLGVSKDQFLIGMVAANKGIPARKCFAEAIAAFAALRERHGDDVVLYLHTQLESPDGEDIPKICDYYGVRPLSFDPYMLSLGPKQQTVAELMQAFDVLLNPALGEGFGVPIIEAQACGTPTIVGDFSAMPEVAPLQAGNFHVSGQDCWTPFNSVQLRPSIESILENLELAYSEPRERREVRRMEVASWVASEYDAEDIITRYWEPVLNESFERIKWSAKKMARASR
jgi:glycosyltransferase involved in cell wall biosynthesis